MTDWSYVDKIAQQWLKTARNTILESFDLDLEISSKVDANDLVTNMDKEIEQYFVDQVKKEFPGHRVFGEEGYGDHIDSLEGVIWIIDPIDGTMNFVHQQRNFFISIGIYENGNGKLGYLYDVVHNELYYAKTGEGAYVNGSRLSNLEKVSVSTAVIGLSAAWFVSNEFENPSEIFIPLLRDVRGTRSYGSAALEFSYVATGKLDAYVSTKLSPWDYAGGKIIVEELGGIVTNLKGEKLDLLSKSPVIVAKPGLHKQLINDYFNKK